MRLSVLSIAYPFAPVFPDAVGGAEQVLVQLDRALVDAGHRSVVIASAGSRIAGELQAGPAFTGRIGSAERRRACTAVREAIADTLAHESIDVIHLHGVDFHTYLPPPGPPVLVTLHLPLEWYPRTALLPARPRTLLHPVSENQARRAPPGVRLLPPIGNGVACPRGEPLARKADFALTLGRVCPEKGFHDAIDAAVLAGVPLLAAGAVFPYAEHERYFANEIAPRLDAQRRWIGRIAGERKQQLLARARCVLIPSRAPETASLVAMEALAAGTPVIAYPSGALPEVVEHGRTGFIVDDVGAMARAIGRAHEIDPAACRQAARERFSIERMTRDYLALYARLASSATDAPAIPHRAQSREGARPC